MKIENKPVRSANLTHCVHVCGAGFIGLCNSLRSEKAAFLMDGVNNTRACIGGKVDTSAEYQWNSTGRTGRKLDEINAR